MATKVKKNIASEVKARIKVNEPHKTSLANVTVASSKFKLSHLDIIFLEQGKIFEGRRKYVNSIDGGMKMHWLSDEAETRATLWMPGQKIHMPLTFKV